LDEPPRSQPQELDDENPQEQVPERLGGDRLDCPSTVRLMPGDTEGHHNRDRPDHDVGDAASAETQAGEEVESAGSPALALPEPLPLRRREYGRP